MVDPIIAYPRLFCISLNFQFAPVPLAPDPYSLVGEGKQIVNLI